MKKIILTRGLPASGKSTWASEFVANSNGKAKRVNKDLLREMIDGGKWSRQNEEMIIKARDLLVYGFIRAGIDTIIIDDTNFEPKHFEAINEILNKCHDNQWHEVNSKSNHYTIEYKDFFEPPVEECIERDSKRLKPVGEKVIRDMWKRYNGIIKPHDREGGPVSNKKGNAIICDLDGTLALKGDRGWFEYDKVASDIVNIPVTNIVKAFADKGYDIIYVSGREGNEICRTETIKWLKQNDLDFGYLFMRQEGDHRNDAIVKEEIYDEFIRDKFDVEFVLDDRQRVVEKWRELGLRCLQVAPGKF